MKKISFTILATFAFSIPFVASASVPVIASCKVNGNQGSASFNPNNSALALDISADQRVKWSTVAICALGDSACTRTSAVKYFTSTSVYAASLSKSWDGKTGGSNPTLALGGQYKLRVTMANQGGETNAPGEFCTASFSVDFSLSAAATSTSDIPGSGDTTSSTPSDSSSSSNTSSSDPVAPPSVQYSASLSSHSDPEPLTDFSSRPDIAVGAGRDRLSLAGSPVIFRANIKGAAQPNILWSFGDGAASAGAEISHIYYYPGSYEVVLDADNGALHGSARARVKVIEPDFSLAALPDGGVKIANNSSYEVNVSGWQLVSGGTRFSFPRDTILAAHSAVSFSGAVTGIPYGYQVFFRSPLGTDIAATALPVPISAVVPAVMPSSVSIATTSAETIAQISAKIESLRAELAKADSAPSRKVSPQASIASVQFQSVSSVSGEKNISQKPLAGKETAVSDTSNPEPFPGMWTRVKDFLADLL